MFYSKNFLLFLRFTANLCQVPLKRVNSFFICDPLEEFLLFFNYVRTLGYNERPSYEFLASLFQSVLSRSLEYHIGDNDHLFAAAYRLLNPELTKGQNGRAQTQNNDESFLSDNTNTHALPVKQITYTKGEENLPEEDVDDSILTDFEKTTRSYQMNIRLNIPYGHPLPSLKEILNNGLDFTQGMLIYCFIQVIIDHHQYQTFPSTKSMKSIYVQSSLT